MATFWITFNYKFWAMFHSNIYSHCSALNVGKLHDSSALDKMTKWCASLFTKFRKIQVFFNHFSQCQPSPKTALAFWPRCLKSQITILPSIGQKIGSLTFFSTRHHCLHLKWQTNCDQHQCNTDKMSPHQNYAQV